MPVEPQMVGLSLRRPYKLKKKNPSQTANPLEGFLIAIKKGVGDNVPLLPLVPPIPPALSHEAEERKD